MYNISIPENSSSNCFDCVLYSLLKDYNYADDLETINKQMALMIEHYILTDRLRKIPDGLPDDMSDNRFSCVRKEEFLSLVYHVDILSPAKPVKKIEELNPERFGVIVTKGTKRGLLLPNLEGIDTVEEQIKIACQKVGIDIRETYNLECFEVVRHT